MPSDRKRHLEESELPYEDSAELINRVIKNLVVAADPTNVAEKYANSLNVSNEVQAYAKIAGRNWTYYVKTLKVSIGRNTESHAADEVDIDLGPSKVVSRRHAEIQYNLDARRWELFVYGRNGLKVDGVRVDLPYGAPFVLGSGNILDVGGTQMMFILPDAAPSIADSFLQNVRDKRPKSTVFQPEGGVRAFQMYRKGPSTAHDASDADYSKDEAKDMKPPYSYATMITQAILSNPQGVLSLSEIYDWIASHFAYYRYSKQGWQNSIRHNLSLNKAFEKVPRRPNEPGKGMKWQIAESYRQEFLQKWRDGTLNKGKRGTSVARQLQIHLMRNHVLPESGRTPVAESGRHRRTRSKQVSPPPQLIPQPLPQLQTAPPPAPRRDSLSYITAAASLTSQQVLPSSSSQSTGRPSLPAGLSPTRLSRSGSNLSSPIKQLVLPDFRTDLPSGPTPVLSRQDSSQERSTMNGQSNTKQPSPEVATPERSNIKQESSSASHPSINSSPALWNYVQFSTPLGSSGLQKPDEVVTAAKKIELESPLRDRRNKDSSELKDVDLMFKS